MTRKELGELRGKRKELKDQIDALIAAAADEKRELTEKEMTDVEKLTVEARDLDKNIDKALDELEDEERKATAKAEIEAEARRNERLERLRKEDSLRASRLVRDESRDGTEIRVHEDFPISSGREIRAYNTIYGNEKRARAEAYKDGMWLLGHMFGNEACRQWSKDYGRGAERRALNNSSNSAGAVLVPDSIMNSIIWNVEDRGVFARYANNVPLGKDDSVFVSKSTGEVTVYAVAENQSSEVTESEPTFDGVELTTKTWGALTRIGRNLADDAVINVAEYVAQKFGYAMADKQDQCGFNGDGTSTYHGITGVVSKINDGTHAASVYDCIAGNVSFATLDLDDFEAAVGKLPQWAEDGDPAWYISKPGFYASMARLMDAAGGNTQDNVQGGKGLQFLGYPVRISQVLNKTLTTQNTTVLCLFGSLRKSAAVATKKELSIQILLEKYATYNQIGVLGFSRWGINAHELGDASNAGAIIAMKTP